MEEQGHEETTKVAMNDRNNTNSMIIRDEGENVVVPREGQVTTRTMVDNTSAKSRGFSIDHLLNSKSGGENDGAGKRGGHFGKSEPVENEDSSFRISQLTKRAEEEYQEEEDLEDMSDEEEEDIDTTTPEELHFLTHPPPPPPPPLLIRPTPLSANHSRSSDPADHLLRLSPSSSSAEASSPSPSSHLLYGPPGSALSPNHMLYSQWLATRNTNALFGLQAPKPSGRRARKPGIDRKPRQAYSAKQLERLENEFKIRGKSNNI